MIVLGVDPGSRRTGYGVLDVKDGKERVLAYGVLNLDAQMSQQKRLKQIYERLTAVIGRHSPDECAIEMPIYGRNPQSMLKLGRAQAAAMLAALNRQIPVVQYTPKEVKKAVTGRGNASKEQVWYMIRTICEISEGDPDLAHDASDALAVGLCHAHRSSTPKVHAGKGWGAFIRDNPDRIA